MTGGDAPLASLGSLPADRAQAAVDACQEIVRIPSFSGDEEAAARCTVAMMERLGYDEVSIDRAGNVLGWIRADAPEDERADDGAVLLCSHLDVVDVGDESAWPHPPFSGVIEDGLLYGRGSTDTKSSLIGQVHGAAWLRDWCRENGITRRRDVLVAAFVQEEVGGLGASVFVDEGPRCATAVIGEPSGGCLAFGHRGRTEVELTFHGRAAHASRPDWGRNPHYSLARFLTRLEDEVAHDEDPQLGPSSVAPTQVSARPASVNVIPSEVQLVLDWRHVPSETPEEIHERVAAVAKSCCGEDITSAVATPSRPLRSWTGVERDIDRVSKPFGTDRNGPLFTGAHSLLCEGLDRDVEVIPWDFASDGGWLHAAGVTCLGYGPGTMKVMHAVAESVSLELLKESVSGYALLSLALCRS
ncbi:MAG: M20/M25/M40 family metallo-hydrolase [Acidobacteriota bacterium]